MNEKAIEVSGTASVARQEFGAQETQQIQETAMTAAAATSKALVEARFIMAMQRPRDWDLVRSKILKAIERPGFAGADGKKTKGEAWYRKPVGEGVEGLSIRFAEEAARCLGNLDVRPVVTYEDDEKRLVDVVVLDLEDNLSYTGNIVVKKTVERSFLKKGEIALRTRLNSKNEPVFTRLATEDEVAQAQAAATSKAIRNGILRLLPGYIQAEAEKRILEIRHGDAATDPTGTQRRIVGSFSPLGVDPTGLKDYLGHELASSTPAELDHLRDLYKAIKAGEVAWQDALDASREDRGEVETNGKKKLTGMAALKAKLASSDEKEGNSEAPEVDKPVVACTHPAFTKSTLKVLYEDKSVLCKKCGEQVPGLKKREAGEQAVII